MKNLNSALCRGIHWSLYFNIYQCLLLRFVTENIFISIERRKTLKIGKPETCAGPSSGIWRIPSASGSLILLRCPFLKFMSAWTVKKLRSMQNKKTGRIFLPVFASNGCKNITLDEPVYGGMNGDLSIGTVFCGQFNIFSGQFSSNVAFRIVAFHLFKENVTHLVVAA